MNNNEIVIDAMINYFKNDIRRINHFLKVYGFACAIAKAEKIDEKTLQILEVAAIVHDIGIKNSEKKYNSSAGNYQQIEGPPEAEKLLVSLGFDKQLIDRVCQLIACHHIYNNITETDYQILVEADFIVNAFEDSLPLNAVTAFCKNIFKTNTGRLYLKNIYNINSD